MNTKYQDIDVKYTNCMNELNKNINDSSLYATELNNIINGNSSLNSMNVPNIEIPTGTPNSSETYDFMYAINPNMKNDNKTTLDKANDDIYELIIQQNTMYIFGSLACASLLIASIIIGKR